MTIGNRSGRRSVKADSLPAGLSVVRQFDVAVIAFWVLAFAACAGYIVIRGGTLAILSLPFAAVGVLYMLYRKNILALIAIAVVAAVLYFLLGDNGHRNSYEIVLLFITTGAVGVDCIVDALQRMIFYRVLQAIRYVNVKDKPSLRERIVAFIFSIPPDLDTRNIMVDTDQTGKRFPWRDMWGTVWICIMVGMFFWIYMSLNPSWASGGTPSFESSLYVFTVMLYVPVIIMPLCIFRSMNARIGTNFRDFKIYNGAVSTIQRMAVPVFAALIFVVLAMQESDNPGAVLVFILMSAAMISIIVLLTSVIYFYSMEAATVSDITKKWKIFMPVPLLVSLRDDDGEGGGGDVSPGTPARAERDISSISVGIRQIKK